MLRHHYPDVPLRGDFTTINAGDYDQAAVWYRRAIDADLGDATGHIYLGAVLARQGRLHEAEEAHRLAIGCAEGCIDEAYFNLGLVLRAQERFAEAADCFRESIRLDPEYRAARRALRDVERCIAWDSGRAEAGGAGAGGSV